MKLTDILDGIAELGEWVAYYPKMARVLGSVNNAVLVSKLIFWSGPGGKEEKDGWIYSDLGKLEDDTGLTTWALRHSRDELMNLGILKSEYLRLTHQLRFKIDRERLNEVWHEYLMKPQMAGETMKPQMDDVMKPQVARQLMKPQMAGHLRDSQVALEKNLDAARAQVEEVLRIKKEEDPPTPKGGVGTETLELQLKTESVNPLEALKERIGSWFGRKATTKWSDKELRLLRYHKGVSESDLADLEAYYKSKNEYLRRDISTLLNNLPGEIDRARAYKKTQARPAKRDLLREV